MVFLEFEKTLEDLQEQLEKAEETQSEGKVDMTETINQLRSTIEKETKNIYKNLTRWQRVQLSRHPERPYTLDYINHIISGFIELHGDRLVKDDKALVAGFGKVDNQTVCIIGHQKGRNTKQRQERNFGMANPEGYRKALRIMKLAEKFEVPIITLIDTPGAYPGIEAEERGQGEAIARNLMEMSVLKVPILCVVIGEGASGGALGIGVGDRVAMLEHTWYSVISPESCSSILWRNWEHKEEAAEALQLTAEDMLKNKLIDRVIKEPFGGAHRNPELACKNVKSEIKRFIRDYREMNADELVKNRVEKFGQMGVYHED
ncbi:MAG: Acetyl-coenzyme A carboxylase carboxyl transferase subunit alpha [Bacteroidetes bacterium MED-G17]|nr:MAG: acetyl-CoA carboxylase carboxyl transferase subunit alpha [Bacteroidetes bacterium TMED39]CAI8365138.1 MAG: Acetyl-coenzyme A carboxylase carboxyl transferase subunit alpha [Bacteroidetes bacterium MED-G17]|tara:strand:- start:8122 stop:9075 length:954 start_codon:yes stop_codon:yes gene_type:complete